MVAPVSARQRVFFVATETKIVFSCKDEIKLIDGLALFVLYFYCIDFYFV